MKYFVAPLISLALFFAPLCASAQDTSPGTPGNGINPPAGDLGGTITNPTVTTVAHVAAGVLGVANGGTGLSTVAANGVMIGEGASPPNATATGTAGQVFTSNGPGVDPSFQPPAGGVMFIAGTLISANFNIGGTGATGDQAIALTGPSSLPWVIAQIVVTNCSASLTTAKGTFYRFAGKSNPIPSQGSATSIFTGLSNSANVGFEMGAANGNLSSVLALSYFTSASQTIYLSLTTPQGATATCDIYVIGQAL